MIDVKIFLKYTLIGCEKVLYESMQHADGTLASFEGVGNLKDYLS